MFNQLKLEVMNTISELLNELNITFKNEKIKSVRVTKKEILKANKGNQSVIDRINESIKTDCYFPYVCGNTINLFNVHKKVTKRTKTYEVEPLKELSHKSVKEYYAKYNNVRLIAESFNYGDNTDKDEKIGLCLSRTNEDIMYSILKAVYNHEDGVERVLKFFTNLLELKSILNKQREEGRDTLNAYTFEPDYDFLGMSCEPMMDIINDEKKIDLYIFWCGLQTKLPKDVSMKEKMTKCFGERIAECYDNCLNSFI